MLLAVATALVLVSVATVARTGGRAVCLETKSRLRSRATMLVAVCDTRTGDRAGARSTAATGRYVAASMPFVSTAARRGTERAAPAVRAARMAGRCTDRAAAGVAPACARLA